MLDRGYFSSSFPYFVIFITFTTSISLNFSQASFLESFESPLFSLQATCQRLRSGQFQATAAGAVTGAAAVGASGGATGLAGGAAIGTAVGSLGASSDVGCLIIYPPGNEQESPSRGQGPFEDDFSKLPVWWLADSEPWRGIGITFFFHAGRDGPKGVEDVPLQDCCTSVFVLFGF